MARRVLGCSARSAEHGGVAVRRFDPHLGLSSFDGQGFQLLEPGCSLATVLRQVAYESKVLSIQTASRQRQQQRHGSNQGQHLQPQIVRCTHH